MINQHYPLRFVASVLLLVFFISFCFNAVSRADWTEEGECIEVSNAAIIQCKESVSEFDEVGQ